MSIAMSAPDTPGSPQPTAPAPEAHPPNTSPPKPRASFTVSSGCLCFGQLHNIWHGAFAPVQSFCDPPPDPRMHGTVRTQSLEFNTAAKNGLWHAYRLANHDRFVTGWFVAHTDVDPDTEMKKLIRVSGHPGEVDSGSSYNDAETAKNGVLVINRYDWGPYDCRSIDEVTWDTVLGAQSASEDSDTSREWAVSEAAGLVDHASARSAVLHWKEQPSSERGATDSGVWMHIPHASYMYGRFGFDDEHLTARSFLFFNGSTRFVQTTFAGRRAPFKKDDTTRELFERRLREGYDFSGRDSIRKLLPPPNPQPGGTYNPPPPPMPQRRGSYSRSEHILLSEDINHALDQVEERRFDGWSEPLSDDVQPLMKPWRESLCELLNGMIMSYLHLNVGPNIRHRGLSDAADALYPPGDRDDQNTTLINTCYRHFIGEDSLASSVLDLNVAGVGGRIKTFLLRVDDPNRAFNDECTAGIARVVAYLLSEVLDVAAYASLASGDDKIMPKGVRVGVLNDAELFAYFKFSRAFWEVIDDTKQRSASELVHRMAEWLMRLKPRKAGRQERRNTECETRHT